MKTSVRTIGDGLGVELPPAAIQEGQLRAGSELEVSIRDGAIVLSPISKAKSRLEELVAQITEENQHELVDWGKPVGGEVW